MAVLEGFHPLKHALRFGAQPDPVITRDAAQLARLTEALAPDLLERVSALAREVSEEVFAQLAPLPPSTGVIALAARPVTDVAALLAGGPGAPVVLLEDPRDLGNMGACVRVAAAADAAAVLTTGGHDPWHPDALRGAAGLHFALPVARLDALEQLLGAARPLLAIDPDGRPLRAAARAAARAADADDAPAAGADALDRDALDRDPLDLGALDARSILAFGSERAGLSEGLLQMAEERVSIPMRAGVSSLNLATSVAALLFAWRLNAQG